MTNGPVGPRCLACGGPHLTPALDVDARGYTLQVSFPPTSDSFLDSGNSGQVQARVFARPVAW